VVTNDAYGTVMVDFQGADLQTISFSMFPEAFRAVGAFTQDPAGWVQLYRRPDPFSTAGLYYAAQLTSGYQGSLFPFVPTIIVKLYLPTESTQASAYIQGGAFSIAITNRKTFIRSLRRLLDANASLKIDPALLTTGPEEFFEVNK